LAPNPGSQKILDAMDKGTTVEQITDARLLMKKKGIKVAFFLQFGYLGETQGDIDATLNMVLKLMPDEIGISVSYPLPGTVFYEKVEETLHEKKNWTDSDDLAMMFRGTYAPAFYRVLHRYVHSRYRIQRGIELAKRILKKPTVPKLTNLKTFASMFYHAPLTMLHAIQLKKFNPENVSRLKTLFRRMNWSPINRAFSKQAVHFDEDDSANPILQAWRRKFTHTLRVFSNRGIGCWSSTPGLALMRFILPERGMLFHATDLSSGMVQQMEKKMAEHPMSIFLVSEFPLSTWIDLKQDRFDYVFSNFGGLNCIRDLSVVTQQLSEKLIPGAYLTWVVMPPVCPWEWLWTFKAKFRDAFRRFSAWRRDGTSGRPAASKRTIIRIPTFRKALGSSFMPVKSEGLGVFSAPPSAMNFYKNYPGLPSDESCRWDPIPLFFPSAAGAIILLQLSKK